VLVGVADHAAQAGAGGGKIVFQLDDPTAKLVVVGGGLTVLVGQPLVVLGQLVDPGDKFAVGELGGRRALAAQVITSGVYREAPGSVGAPGAVRRIRKIPTGTRDRVAGRTNCHWKACTNGLPVSLFMVCCLQRITVVVTNGAGRRFGASS
jgi:hypothetical protein